MGAADFEVNFKEGLESRHDDGTSNTLPQTDMELEKEPLKDDSKRSPLKMAGAL